ncbi:hypothetical protein EUAN_22190 [Andreesenia angusta]|uniref:Uncharacterized protein n=1 Tax=Andreesenia angusta TaxID=39480 RepID=A0A1S1V6Q7_9FIRM|nr:hypothetical protein [Andreesenia angusta]OHW61369.1 hypothetical protein EUAN_22190 [Andreesenia angusta]
MLFYDERGNVKLSEHKVIYTQRGERVEQYIGAEGKEWWIHFAEKWGHTEIVSFEPVIHEKDQIARLKEVNRFTNIDLKNAETYIFGKVEQLDDTRLNSLKMQKEILELQNYIVEQEFKSLIL